MTSRTREAAAALGIAALLAVVMTWPIAARFCTAGRLDSGDGRFSVWNVAWVAHALTTHPSRLYDANIFYPHDDALAYSEANLVAGVLAVPVWLVTKNPYATSNWTILCAFVLSGLAAYALARHLTGRVAASAFTAIAYAYCPYVFSHIPHIQLLMSFGPPLALLALHRFVEAPSPARSAWLGGALALQALACGYYGIYGGLAVVLGVLWLGVATGRWRHWRYWLLGLSAAALAAAIVAPFFAPYAGMRAGGFQRTLADARLFSAGWRSYLASGLFAHQWLLPIIGTWREVLFPGFLPLLLAPVAVAVAFGLVGRLQTPVSRPIVGFYLALGALAGWASFGPQAGLYTVLFHTVPFFSMLRAPARFALIVALAAAVLGGIGFAALESLVAGRRRLWLVAGTMALLLAGSTPGGLALVDAPPLPQAYRQLVNLPWGPVLELPYFTSATDRSRNTEYMLMSTFHWKPLINGYSDYIPGDSYADSLTLGSFPGPEAWRVLRRLGARYVLIHWPSLARADRVRLVLEMRRLTSNLRPVVRSPDVSLFEIVLWPDD
jgi:hypothetical protein